METEKRKTPPDTAVNPSPQSRGMRLPEGRVLVVGVGGLGSPAAMHLAAAGVGTIGIVDADAVDLSNLQRQILYRTADIGRRKVAVASTRLRACFPAVAVHTFDARLEADNVSGIIAEFDFVIDATDGIVSKYLINDAAVLQGIPFVHAGVVGFQGQVLTVIPGRTACLRCLFPIPPEEGEVPTCQESGILGALAGSIGVLQATEAIKFLLGVGQLVADRLLTYDAIAARWRSVTLQRQPDCPVCGDEPTIRTVAVLAPHHEVCS